MYHFTWEKVSHKDEIQMKVEERNKEKLKKYLNQNREKINVYLKQIEPANSGVCDETQANKKLEIRKLR